MDKKRKNSSAPRSAELADTSSGRSSGAARSSETARSSGSRVVRSPDYSRRASDTARRSSYYSGYDSQRGTERRTSQPQRESYGQSRYSSSRSSVERGYSTRYTQSGSASGRTERGVYSQRERSSVRSDAAKYQTERGRQAERKAESEPRRGTDSQRRITDADRRRKMEQERKQRLLRQKRIKAAAVFGLFLLVAVILIFMTPVFNIRQITLEGNSSVTKEQIQEKVGDLIGKNLFATTSGKIEARVKEIPQVSSADAAKKLFPPSIKLSITECSPAAYLLSGNKIIVIDSDLKILDDSNSFNTDVIPSISGISIPSYTLNTRLSSDSAEKEEILSTMLKSFESTGLLSSVSYVSLDDLTNIKFNYKNKIEADCGSQLELDRKIRMFAAAVSSDSLDANTTGTIDLSVPGTAVLDR